MVMSATYRQDSRLRPELRDVDPDNRLLASQSPRRLEAEFVRDNALAIAGLLNLDVGGPSVNPYQPAGYYANLQFPDRDYVADARRPPVPPRRLHALAADVPAPDAGQLRRPVARGMHRRPDRRQHAAAGPDAAERPDVRRGRARAGREAARATPTARTTRPASTLLYQRRWPGRAKPAERAVARRRSSPSSAPTTAADPDDAEKLAPRRACAPRRRTSTEPSWPPGRRVCRVVLNLHETITRY